MKKVIIFSLVIGLLGFGVLAFAADDHPSDKPLKLPFDMGYRPFHYYNDDGEPAGFGIEVSREIADRLGRPGLKIVDVNWSGIFSGLFAKKYEAITFTLNVTRDRAQRMDYTEPFMSCPQGAAVRKEDADEITKPEDLEGKTLGVNSGSVADGWATDNKDKYGFKVKRTDKVADAVMGLRTGSIDAILADAPTAGSFVKESPNLVRSFNAMTETDWGVLNQAGFGMAVRQDDEEFRRKLERVIEGMKIDGTLQEIMSGYSEFFGEPGPSDYVNVVFTGYGTPGLPAYEPDEYHTPYIPE
ncbi:amino acid ABC transporter substrate-binding protein [Candidatus Bipolaricaulota bacterium]|nr:amino acid ABC transporter substrate-binding protein [Candidatus Bipolaricaulota bacterium]